MAAKLIGAWLVIATIVAVVVGSVWVVAGYSAFLLMAGCMAVAGALVWALDTIDPCGPMPGRNPPPWWGKPAPPPNPPSVK